MIDDFIERWEPDDPNWLDAAACKDMDSEVFFPGRGMDLQPAKQVCKRCPIKELCLEYALRNEEKFGVWGGTSERERRAMRRERRSPDAAVPIPVRGPTPIQHGTVNGYKAHMKRGIVPACDACRAAQAKQSRLRMQEMRKRRRAAGEVA